MSFNNFHLAKYIKLVKRKTLLCHFSSKSLRKPPWRVLFFGTDEFSIYTLNSLNQEYRKGSLIDQLEVVTTVKGKSNSVKLFCDENNLNTHKWVPCLKYGQFDVGLVVSFGHLIPINIIDKFQYGMLNVHASLLPRWRGAAPIIYALANGDKETGVTIMKISPEKFDVGDIVRQEKVPISPHVKMKDLHRTLGKLGALNLIETLKTLPESLDNAKPQSETGVTYAPKVTTELSFIDWGEKSSVEVYNLARALDGMSPLHTKWKDTNLKLFNVSLDTGSVQNKAPGFFEYDKFQKVLKILCADLRFIAVGNVGVTGKKLMTSADFNNGYLKKEPVDLRYFNKA